MKEKLDSIKWRLIDVICAQMDDLPHVNAEELGEVVDMVKDIEEAKYYCAITKAMEEKTDLMSMLERVTPEEKMMVMEYVKKWEA